MNINSLLPKHVNIDAVRANAQTYEGTFAELKSLVDDKKVTLVTNAEGDVSGIWVNSGAEDLMIDQLAGENFNRAYCCKPVMRWVEMILNGEEPTEPTELVESDSDLPHRVEGVDLTDGSLSTVRNYLKRTYGYCLAKGEQPTIEYFDGRYNISDIQWGRKLTASELSELA